MEGDRKAADPRLPGCAISIHSLRMEGDAERTMEEVAVTSISIHSLRMEGDTVPIFEGLRHNISIHSLRMEGDIISSSSRMILVHFNPLPPHGGRHGHLICAEWYFLISIHSLRMEGDVSFLLRFQSMCISIHSLRMEGDYI